jgi:hypothetical protein
MAVSGPTLPAYPQDRGGGTAQAEAFVEIEEAAGVMLAERTGQLNFNLANFAT